jgi:phosphoenolpyruvate-protein kinase (PTS system EI component)
LRTQLDTLLQLSADFDLHILVPMVTLPSDIEAVNQVLQELAAQRDPSLALPRLVEWGIRSVSVVPTLIPEIKEVIKAC